MKPAFFPQDKTCPVCQTKFTITRVKSSAYQVVKRDTDFNVIYSGPDPNLYNIVVCPKCLFATPLKSFDVELRKAEMERLVKGLPLFKDEEPDFSGERDLQVGLRTYELAIRTAQIRQASAGFQASLFLKIAWIWRQLNDTENELKFLDLAREKYEYSFFNETSTGPGKMSEPTMIYLIGELNRRCGKYAEAIQWFSRGISHPQTNTEAQVKRMMRDQWQLSRELAKEAAKEAGNSEDSATTDGESDDAEPTTTEVVPEVIESHTIVQKRYKNKLFASLYHDQIEWLQGIANNIYADQKILLERDAVLRSVIDTIMHFEPEIKNISSEEELATMLIQAIQQKATAD